MCGNVNEIFNPCEIHSVCKICAEECFNYFYLPTCFPCEKNDAMYIACVGGSVLEFQVEANLFPCSYAINMFSQFVKLRFTSKFSDKVFAAVKPFLGNMGVEFERKKFNFKIKGVG